MDRGVVAHAGVSFEASASTSAYAAKGPRHAPAPAGVARPTVAPQPSAALRKRINDQRAKKSLRQQVWAFCDDPQSGPMAARFAKLIMLLILVSCTSFVLSTEESLAATHERTFASIEVFCIAVFSFEVTLRTLSCPSYAAYVRDPFTWVDFLAILPFSLC